MKYFLLYLLFIFLSINSEAQFELKSSPIGILFAAPSISMEYIVKEDIGVETTAWIFPSAGEGMVYLLGKYYFKPRGGADRFNTGIFVAGGSFGVGAGFYIGQKIVASRGIVFEFALGAGRGFTDFPAIPYFKLDLGYRFNKKSRR